jgi:hypothetical protein
MFHFCKMCFDNIERMHAIKNPRKNKLVANIVKHYNISHVSLQHESNEFVTKIMNVCNIEIL